MNPRVLLLLVALSLAACGKEVVLPPAQPLSASAEQLAQIPKLEGGPHAVHKGEPVDWQLAQRRLRVRVVRPDAPGPFPLVLFSHGNWSDITQYDALLEHWASHGYVTLAPFHPDGGGMARGIFNALLKGNLGMIVARVDEVHAILDHLDHLDQVEPGLAARVDVARIAAAGHSFGAFTAQQLGGARAIDLDSGAHTEGRDARISAVIAISPPGPMFEIINDQSWKNLDTPMLATTGTWDVNAQFWPEWTAHRLSYDTARPGKNWLLVVEGADHYLGNLICRTEREAAPQNDALRMVNALSVNFLDAYLKDDEAARAFLQTRPLGELTGGFASLERR